MIEHEKYGSKPFEYIIKAINFREEGNRLLFNCITDKERNMFVGIHVLDERIIKVFATFEDDIPKYNYDLVANKNFEGKNLKSSINKKENYVELLTSQITVEISLDPWNISFKDKRGTIVLSEHANDVNAVGKLRARPLGVTYESGSNNVLACNETFKINHKEHFYGFGEKFTEFDKRGQKIIMWNKDALGVRNEIAYKNVPFFMSTSGYGLFVNSTEAVEFDIGNFSNSSLTISVPGQVLDYYFIFGPDFKDILYLYTKLTGNAPVPPLWSFGLWMSTGFFEANRNSMEECAKKVRDKKIPCDVMHFDCFWLRDNMWCDFEWDENNYPNAEEMIQGLKDQGFKVCLWINPYVSERSDMFKEGVDKEYFIKKRDGTVYIKDMWHGLYPPCAIIDITNPDAVNWLKGKLRKLLKMGVDVFKTDFGEDIPEDAIFYNGQTGVNIHNLYSLLYNKAVFEVTKEFKDKPIVWGRSGYAGSQKYPVCWSGDPACTYEAMAAVLRGGLSYGMSGVPFWSHDIGGFYGKPTTDLYIRWAQFGLFSSHSRCHGTTDREPWVFGEEAEKIFIKYAKLRYKLMPYIYSTALKSSKTGLPFIRPLVLMNQNDPTTFHIDDEYYFGDDILIAPVFTDNNQRMIYLPEGGWVDYWDTKIYKGKQWIRYDAPLDILPIFIRKGAVIPVINKELQSIEKDILEYEIELEVYDNESTSSDFYTEKGVMHIKVDACGNDVNISGTDFPVHMKLLG